MKNIVWCQNKKYDNIFGSFGGLERSDPKVIGIIETSSSRWFIWHLEKSIQTEGY